MDFKPCYKEFIMLIPYFHKDDDNLPHHLLISLLNSCYREASFCKWFYCYDTEFSKELNDWIDSKIERKTKFVMFEF